MNRINKYKLLLIFLFLSSCATPLKKNNEKKYGAVIYDKIASVSPGQNYKQVISILGEPQIEKTQETKGILVKNIEYKNSDEFLSQRASVQFDVSKDKVIAVTFIPNADEAESSLDFFLEKFNRSLFSFYYKARCASHTSVSESIAVNREKGILIKYSQNDLWVQAVSWWPPEGLTSFIKSLETCQKSKSSP